MGRGGLWNLSLQQAMLVSGAVVKWVAGPQRRDPREPPRWLFLKENGREGGWGAGPRGPGP